MGKEFTKVLEQRAARGCPASQLSLSCGEHARHVCTRNVADLQNSQSHRHFVCINWRGQRDGQRIHEGTGTKSCTWLPSKPVFTLAMANICTSSMHTKCRWPSELSKSQTFRVHKLTRAERWAKNSRRYWNKELHVAAQQANFHLAMANMHVKYAHEMSLTLRTLKVTDISCA